MYPDAQVVHCDLLLEEQIKQFRTEHKKHSLFDGVCEYGGLQVAHVPLVLQVLQGKAQATHVLDEVS